MSTRTGLIGEMYASGIIMALGLGFKVTHCPQDHVDLVAWKDDEFFRIQVKTAKISGEKDRRLPTYHFQFGHGQSMKHIGTVENYDILCCVAFDIRQALFLPVSEVLQYSKRLSPELFDAPKSEIETFSQAVDEVRRLRKQKNG